jgi:integrase
MGRDGIFKRKGALWISYTLADGRRRQEKTHEHSITEVRKLRAAKLAEVEKQKTLGYTPPTKDTFASFVPTYLAHQKPRLTPDGYERSRGIAEDHLKAAFGSMRLADIRADQVGDYIDKRLLSVKPGTVVREVNVLKNLLEYALEKGRIAVNHVRRMKLPKANDERVRHIGKDGLKSILTECPEWLRPIVALLVATGMRRSEALKLRWSWIDKQANCIVIPKAKSGKFRLVRLNSLAWIVLDARPKGTALVFPPSEQLTPANVSLAFHRACVRAKVEDFRLHDLRHTFASRLRNLGVGIQEISELLGHSDLRMTKRYSHIEPDVLQKAAERLGEVLPADLFGHDGVTMDKGNQSLPVSTSIKRLSA